MFLYEQTLFHCALRALDKKFNEQLYLELFFTNFIFFDILTNFILKIVYSTYLKIKK